MKCCRVLYVVSLLLLATTAWTGPAWSADPVPKPETRPVSSLVIWDTGKPSGEALAPAAFAGEIKWPHIPQDKTADSFKGDAVMSNGRIIAVLRKQASAVEVYAVKPDQRVVARLGLRLVNFAGEPATRLERIALVENTKDSACLEASFKTAKGTEVAGKFRIKRGDAFIQAEPGAGAGKLHVDCPGRFVVLPDFFADDITVDATKLPVASAELPSENLVLHLTAPSLPLSPVAGERGRGEGGDAIAMCVFENRQQDVRITLTGAGDKRIISASEIGFEGKKVWVALLEAPNIWHTHDLKANDAGKVIALDWALPFLADWRVDFPRPDELTDSWQMLLQDKKGGSYTKPSFLGSGEEKISSDRNHYLMVLGSIQYPCWSDFDQKAYLQPLQSSVLKFQGTTVIYPINRVRQTPLDAYTVVDVMRNTLGVGPCEQLLDLEGQRIIGWKGMPTCHVRDKLNSIYEKKQQQEKRADVDKTLDDGLTFVKHIRSRISQYVEFGHTMRDYLAEQKKAHPELADFITEMEKLNQEIDKRVEARLPHIKTPGTWPASTRTSARTCLVTKAPTPCNAARLTRKPWWKSATTRTSLWPNAAML